MATETLTVQSSLRTGAELAMQSVTSVGGFKFLNDGRTIMIAVEVNTGDNEITVTPVRTVDGLAAAARTVDVASDETWVLGPWPQEIYNDSDGFVTFTTEADEASGIGLISMG